MLLKIEGDITMRCPYCKSTLTVVRMERLETLDEHVCYPNEQPSLKESFGCINASCIESNERLWDYSGDCYGGSYSNSKPALDSLSCRLAIEIFKHDEDHNLFSIGNFQFRVEYIYQANDAGEILKRIRAYSIHQKSSRIILTTKKRFFLGAILDAFISCPYRFGKFYSDKHGEKWYTRMKKNYKELIFK